MKYESVMGISNKEKVIIGTFSKCSANQCNVDVKIEERYTVVHILRGGNTADMRGVLV